MSPGAHLILARQLTLLHLRLNGGVILCTSSRSWSALFSLMARRRSNLFNQEGKRRMRIGQLNNGLEYFWAFTCGRGGCLVRWYTLSRKWEAKNHDQGKEQTLNIFHDVIFLSLSQSIPKRDHFVRKKFRQPFFWKFYSLGVSHFLLILLRG